MDMLRRFRLSGRKVFLVTNSLWEYTNTVSGGGGGGGGPPGGPQAPSAPAAAAPLRGLAANPGPVRAGTRAPAGGRCRPEAAVGRRPLSAPPV